MKRISIITAALAALLCGACSNIAEEDRLVYVEPAQGLRRVLIEDFTGQRCSGCPKATEAIGEIESVYGDEVIPVAIHCGPLGFRGNKGRVGLMTDLTQEYWNAFFPPTVNSQPWGKVNRGEADQNYGNWSYLVREELEKPTDVDIDLYPVFDAETRQISVLTKVKAPAGTRGKLQLWLLEDGIVAMQTLPDGTVDMECIHNHVLRDAINGIWGEDISVAEQVLEFTHSYALCDASKAENCSVVAFVYDDSGVKQAIRRKLTVAE